MKEAEKRMKNYLKTLLYQPSNYKNIGVHYGENKAICIERKSSAFISEGQIDIFCEQPDKKTLHYNIDVKEPVELKNETSKKIFVKLDESILMPNRPGDYTLHIKNGILDQ
jgi:hypothetical protein|tara:strand:- start:146 stop:478 length:333 start_codon:yes stop_codon:yes gene_type:complete